MSAMGDRLLLLEDTADALDAIDPELANQFRLVNGLPDGYLEALTRADRAEPSDAGTVSHSCGLGRRRTRRHPGLLLVRPVAGRGGVG